jgi:CxxC-x17-CxxC domain-containing protein
MGNFQGGGNRGGGFRGGNGGGGRPSFGGGRGGDRGEVTMHKAVCDECHKSCEVPFRPSNDKPIYCNECFSSKRGNEERAPRREFNDRGPRRESSDRPAPSFAKPVSAPAPEDMKNLFREINVKLDRLTSAIEKLSQPKVLSQSSYVKPVVKVAPVVAKVEVKKTPVAKVVAKKVIVKAPVKKVIKKGKK